MLGRRIEIILARTQARLLNLSPRARTLLCASTAAAALAAVFLVSTPARSMVRAQIRRLAPSPVVVAGHPADHTVRTITRSHESMRSKPSAVLPALLALASGAVQVNLPADAVANPAVKPAAVVKSTASTTSTAAPLKSNDVIIDAHEKVRVHTLPVNVDTTAPAPAASDVSIPQDKPCSMDFDNIPVETALRKFFKEYGANFTIAQDVHGSVNIDIQNMGMLAALRSILHANTAVPLTYDFTDGVYNVRVKATQPTSIDASTTQTTDQPADNLGWELPVNHLTARDMVDKLNDAVAQGIIKAPSGCKVSVIPGKNSVEVLSQSGVIAQVRDYAQQIDISPQQVRVGISLVKTTKAELRKLGVDTATFESSTSEQAKINAALVSGRLGAYESPRLITTDGVQATISMAESGALSTYGTTVSVTPTVKADHSIAEAVHVGETLPDPNTAGRSNTRSLDVNQNTQSGESHLVASDVIENRGRHGSDEVQLIFVSTTLLDDQGNPVVADASTTTAR